MNNIRYKAIESCNIMKQKFIKKLIIDEKVYNELKELIEEECEFKEDCIFE